MHGDVHSSQTGIGSCFGYEWRPWVSVPLATPALLFPVLITDARALHPSSCGYLEILTHLLSAFKFMTVIKPTLELVI